MRKTRTIMANARLSWHSILFNMWYVETKKLILRHSLCLCKATVMRTIINAVTLTLATETVNTALLRYRLTCAFLQFGKFWHLLAIDGWIVGAFGVLAANGAALCDWFVWSYYLFWFALSFPHWLTETRSKHASSLRSHPLTVSFSSVSTSPI